MVNNLAHTIRLYPNKAQETFFRKACGCARVAYNYGLQLWFCKRDFITVRERVFECSSCGMVKDRDRNAADNLRNYGLKQLRAVSPEVTPVDKKALVYSSSIGINETILDEAGIYRCSKMST